jgi:hypothetical protein
MDAIVEPGGESGVDAARDTGSDAPIDSASEAAFDAASDAAGDAAADAGAVTFLSSCHGTPTTLTGTVLAPNGADPIPGVRVYAASQENGYPAPYCNSCSAPVDQAYVATASAFDGTFSLSLDSVPQGANIDFVIQVGRFRKRTVLPVTACQSALVPKAAATLPGTSAAGDIPKIAVSSGNSDHLDALLVSIGITEFDCYEGRKTAGANTATCQQVPGKVIADVLADSTQLGAYHMLFLSSAPQAYAQFITNHTQATMTANTQTWVAGGGRMLATDTAYDYVAQAFPAAITFAGPSGSPQPVDGANIGCAPLNGATLPQNVAYWTQVDDPTLSAWLKVVGIPTNPVSIVGYTQPWSVISSLAATTVRVADATMPLDNMTAPLCTPPIMQDVPVAAVFDVPTCGRVGFTSFISNSTVSGAAQEKILEGFVFGLETCHP